MTERATFLLASIALLAMAVGLASCQQMTFGVIYNSGESPLVVSYRVSMYESAVDGTERCPLDVDSGQRPQIQQGSPKGSLGAAHWTDIAHYRSADAPCQARFELPPDHSALVFTNGWCDDYERFQDDGVERSPTFESLTLQGPNGERRFTRWEAATVFERVSRNLCLLEIP